MEVIGFLAPWILIGIGVIFVSFSGGPGAAREAYLTRGRRTFGTLIVLTYIGVGIAVPAVVIASRGDRQGNTQKVNDKLLRDGPEQLRRGKELFSANCAQCHALDAVNARGIAGPDLDKIGQVTSARVMSAIRIGGTGQNRMPAQLLEGENARAVAAYVATVAGE